ncbi:AraC family transcriptional regulator [Stakelama pacifica]|uniref:AraC-like DNA-binding protein n=1 Tax=Stakelama pacifica TaxID=517720 RepID=A0A4R6FL36_9SPHN|nr:AraC family transcriptional regulator [Stakelama pacifica]TDN81620.1 AraC-like DNA-binding protein [Stakelama pacifica]GGO96070.1 AraC family transcriptional regulator [Stakelama pacifica]
MRKIEELAAAIEHHGVNQGISATAIPNLSLIRADRVSVPVPAVYEASCCIIAQGAKQVSLGDQHLFYDATKYLIASVDLPVVGHVQEASPEQPYLCCKIDLNLAALNDMIMSQGMPAAPTDLPVMAVYPTDPDLLDAACRLIGLLDQPDSIATLAPLIEREILYRLLTGPHGALLRHQARADSHLNQVSRAIRLIRERFEERLRIGEIAAAAGMSESSLHAHFKSITRMTPIEFQKQLRLQEARRLMTSSGSSASEAGFAVGYDSPSQFSREYRRLFGLAPRQDVDRLRAEDRYVGAV